MLSDGDKDRIKQITERLSKATERPWVWFVNRKTDPDTEWSVDSMKERYCNNDCCSGHSQSIACDFGRPEDAEFVKHAPDDIEWLIEKLEEKND